MPSKSIFLSHSWHDKDFVRRLNSDLVQWGIRTWMDDAEIRVGDSLIQKIRAGIDEMDFVGVVLSPTSVSSEWVQREIDVAMNQEIEGRRVKVLPILLERCDLPGFLKGKAYADFTSIQSYSRGLRQLLATLGVDGTNQDEQLRLFRSLVDLRLRGSVQAADELSEAIRAKRAYASAAALELAFHEFARLREHRSLATIERLSAQHSEEPFISRAFALLRAMCLISLGRVAEATHIVASAPGRSLLKATERTFLALHEAIFCLARGDGAGADGTLKEAWQAHITTGDEYPPFKCTRPFDRALMDCALGDRPVAEVVKELPFQTFRGAAQLSAVNARVMRKSRGVLSSLESASHTLGWRHTLPYSELQRRLRAYEVFLLSNSGTLFPGRADRGE